MAQDLSDYMSNDKKDKNSGYFSNWLLSQVNKLASVGGRVED